MDHISLTAETEIDSQAETSHIAGVDGGGTKTLGIITDDSFYKLGESVSDPSNPLRVGTDRAVQEVVRALEGACGAAGIDQSDLAGIGIGLGGVRHEAHYQATVQVLRAAFPDGRFVLVPDAEIALIGATGGLPGVVVIAGTGSVACGINAQGEVAYSGGWGPAFGDEGSGYDIARRALMAAAAHFDGRGKFTVITEEVCRFFQVPNPMELLNIIYSHYHPVDSPQIAPLAQLVVKAAQAGDQIANEILHEAGTELARTAIAVIRRLHMEHDAFRVAYVGSVFQAGEFILNPFGECLAMVIPQAFVSAPLYSPAIGAAMLARQRFLGR